MLARSPPRSQPVKPARAEPAEALLLRHFVKASRV